MTRLTIICDRCHKELSRDAAVNWIAIRRTGVEVRTALEVPFGGDFCSAQCAIEFLETTKEKSE